eukprot:10404393-Karenia_brevis.AAC.1
MTKAKIQVTTKAELARELNLDEASENVQQWSAQDDAEISAETMYKMETETCKSHTAEVTAKRVISEGMAGQESTTESTMAGVPDCNHDDEQDVDNLLQHQLDA